MKRQRHAQYIVGKARLATDWRFWASLPTVTAVQFLGPRDRGARSVVAKVTRPKFPRGVCRTCGCTHFDPCDTGLGPCAWTDRKETLCTACAPDADAKETR